MDRIVEVDVDESRNPTVYIRNVLKSPHRSTPLEDDPNVIKDIQVLCDGLIAAILYAEQTGELNKGEAMERTIKYLNDWYVDISCKVVGVDMDENGKVK